MKLQGCTRPLVRQDGTPARHDCTGMSMNIFGPVDSDPMLYCACTCHKES